MLASKLVSFMSSQLTLASYNSTGFGPGKPEYVSDLLKSYDFVLLQEHWLRKSQFHRIRNIPCDSNVSILSHDVSAIDDNIFINGRGYGGCSIIWKSTLNCKVVPIIMSSNRICAVQVTLQSMVLIIFNVYMPCDDGKNNELYIDILNEITSKCNELGCFNFIIGGDFNTNFKRTKSNFTKHLNFVCENEHLYPCIYSKNSIVPYTFTSPVDQGKHIIDHFLVNKGMVCNILEYFSVHDGANVSFHSPVVLKLNFTVGHFMSTTRTYISKPKWQEASGNDLLNYKNTIDNLLNTISIPWDAIKCECLHCPSQSDHCHDIQIFHDSLMECCIKAGEICIPFTSANSPRQHKLAGWNDYVKPYKDASMFWHNIWRDCGSPRNAVIADVMRRARAKYHKAIRYVKNNENNIKRDNMAHALLNNKTRDFWKEVKAVNNKDSSLPKLVDDVMGDENISDFFANKYESLYNSVSYDEADMNSLLGKIDSMIKDMTYESNTKLYISVQDIIDGIKQVKLNKKDGYCILYTDHFINATNKLYICLSLLFNSMIVHGFTPDGFNVATIQPLVKDKRKSVNDSNNYRAIALSSPLSKIFDWIILNKNSSLYNTSDLQFGFKPHSSTTQCTFALTETINYFKQNNSDTYVLLLDATKAFDKVNYTKLFELLINKGLNPLLVRCLIFMYTNQHLNVTWNNNLSKYFSTSNGVKQGGVLSPILFAIYIDELLDRLKQSGFGCMIGHLYCGAFGYADDVSLVAPSMYALKKMSDICLHYAEEYDLQFNPTKCQLIKYGDVNMETFSFNNTIIYSTRKGTHLGHIIGPDVIKDSVREMSHDLTWRVNSIISNFNFCKSNVKYNLFRSYCTSFYGACLWNMQDKAVNMFYTTWRKSIRKIFDIPQRTHCNLLPLIADCLPIQIQFLSRIVRFIQSCIRSHNDVLNVLSNLALSGSGSSVAGSCNFIMSKYKLVLNDFYTFSHNRFISLFQSDYFKQLDVNILENASLVCDILYSIESGDPFLNGADLKYILHCICTE